MEARWRGGELGGHIEVCVRQETRYPAPRPFPEAASRIPALVLG